MQRSTSFMPEPGSVARRRRGPILVVDDYEDARATIREGLEARGHEVLEASNGHEALHLLTSPRGGVVALIVLDLQMPVMDGWQFLGLLQNYVRLASIPVLIASGHVARLDEPTRKRVIGCIQAPYSVEDLVALVDAYTTPSVPPASS
jgi:CheY-like chemotaxis protein